MNRDVCFRCAFARRIHGPNVICWTCWQERCELDARRAIGLFLAVTAAVALLTVYIVCQ